MQNIMHLQYIEEFLEQNINYKKYLTKFVECDMLCLTVDFKSTYKQRERGAKNDGHSFARRVYLKIRV